MHLKIRHLTTKKKTEASRPKTKRTFVHPNLFANAVVNSFLTSDIGTLPEFSIERDIIFSDDNTSAQNVKKKKKTKRNKYLSVLGSGDTDTEHTKRAEDGDAAKERPERKQVIAPSEIRKQNRAITSRPIMSLWIKT